MKCLQVGLVGFGFAGRIFHSSVIEAVEGLELAAIVQRSGNSAATAFPHVKIVPSVDALLQDTSIRLVVVATPNATHLPIARQCLLAGRDVVIDKPFAMTSSEAAELIRLARSQGRLLSVYQNRRWDGDFLTVRKLLDGDQLGRLVKFESHYDRFRLLPRLHSWREDGSPGGGVLIDLGAHLVDQALVLFGVPHSVWASVRVEREGGRTDDAFDLYLHYPAPPAQVSSSPSGPAPSGLGVWLRATCLARDPEARFTLERHEKHLSQIRHRSPGGPPARRRYVFLQALGRGKSGALGHPHHRGGRRGGKQRASPRSLGTTAATTSTFATRSMAMRPSRSLPYKRGEPCARWRWRSRAAGRDAQLRATGRMSRKCDPSPV